MTTLWLQAALCLLSLATVASSLPAKAASVAPADRVHVQRGELPILLTAPHGGRETIAAIERRVGSAYGSDKSRNFKTGGDEGTFELAQAIARNIQQKTGRPVYLVAARFVRYQIDANRPATRAFEAPQAAPYYERYHASIRSYIDEIRRRFPHAILLDVHGQHTHPQALERGTDNGRTIERLLKRAGQRAVTGADGLFGQFEARGIAVYPSNALPVFGKAENGGHNGGYTVATYGSHRADGIDGFQLEFGNELRRREVLDEVAAKAATAILRFYDVYVAK
jgi:N-formylglutamate amidohydrolase